jgi:hypothetical protein
MNAHTSSAPAKATEMKIGKIKYIVTTHCNPNGRETAEQKYLRYVTERVAEELKKPQSSEIVG